VKNAKRMPTDAEVVTLAVAQAMMGIPSDARFLKVARKQLKRVSRFAGTATCSCGPNRALREPRPSAPPRRASAHRRASRHHLTPAACLKRATPAVSSGEAQRRRRIRMLSRSYPSRS
jgi:hypothetical protein